MLKGLKHPYTQIILTDFTLADKIAKVFGKSVWTIHRYARANHYNLTLPGVLDIIREHLKLSTDTELLEDRPALQQAA